MFFHLLYLSLTATCSSEYISSEITEISYLQDVRLVDNSSIAMSTASVLKCAANCGSNASCLSMSYNAADRQCMLYTTIFSIYMAGIFTDYGWKCYIKKVDCPVESGYIYNQTLDLVTDVMRKGPDDAEFCWLDGGHMIKINSMKKQLHINDFLRSLGVNSVWFGGRSENKDNNFLYDDGTALSFTFWRPDQPSGNRFIYGHKEYGYLWKNGSGGAERSFLCEIS